MITQKELVVVHEHLLSRKRTIQIKSEKFLFAGLLSIGIAAVIAMAVFKIYVPTLIFALTLALFILIILDSQKRRIRMIEGKKYTVLKEEVVFKSEVNSASANEVETVQYLVTMDADGRYYARTCSPLTYHKASPQDIVYIISLEEKGAPSSQSKGISKQCKTIEEYKTLYRLEHGCILVYTPLIIECVFEKDLSNLAYK